MQLARILFQLMENGSLLSNAFPNGWSSSRHLAFLLLEAWHNLVLSAEALLRLFCQKIIQPLAQNQQALTWK